MCLYIVKIRKLKLYDVLTDIISAKLMVLFLNFLTFVFVSIL